MKIFLILLFFLVLISETCKSVDNSQLSRQNFVFTIDFYPAFMPPWRLVLQKKGDVESLSISSIFGDKPKNKKGLIIEKVVVSKSIFQQFQDSLVKIDLSKQKSKMKIVIDGININFKFKTDSIINNFGFTCPRPSDTSEFRIIKALFNMMDSSFKTKTAINYIERLKEYFDFGLLVKHISDNPIEYRFYASLSSGEANEFYQLMRSLPEDKPIIFDLSNFESMGTMFYPDFQTLIKKNPNVYWLVNNDSRKQVLEIGVKPERIFMNRRKLMTKVKKSYALK